MCGNESASDDEKVRHTEVCIRFTVECERDGRLRMEWHWKEKAGAHRINERRCYIGGYGWWLACSVCMSFGVEVGCFTWANSMYHEEIMYNIRIAAFFGVAFAIFMDLSHSF